MAELEVRVQLVEGSLSLATCRGHSVTIDRPRDKGGTDQGFLGGELVLAGEGGCFLSNLVAAARARSIDLRRAEVTVRGTQADNPPHFAAVEVAVRIDADAPAAEIDKLLQIAGRSCIASNTLRSGTVLSICRETGDAR
jgi:putative redox protein